ncbi:MAG: hypothetical protein V8T87_09655 [Victivallales bacterium]
MSRRDGNGGFLRNERALDFFGRAPAPTTNAYILWTLLESGTSPVELSREIEHVKKIALQSEDSYIRALGANVLFLAHDGKNAFTGFRTCRLAGKERRRRRRKKRLRVPAATR